jgi:hypothetical protein
LIGPWTHIPRRPVRSNDGIAEVQAAIEYEYEYRFAEYEYEEVDLLPISWLDGTENTSSHVEPLTNSGDIQTPLCRQPGT